MCAFYQVMKFMRPLFIRYLFQLKLFLCMVCLINPIVAISSTLQDDTDSAVRAVIEMADALQLGQHESWLALLHYKQEMVSRRVLSQADDNDFFLDEKGKTNPDAELIANIKGFLRGPENNHAQCRFPARWWWLKRQIKILDKYDVRCSQLEAFMLRVSHDKLFLVFPTMYLNNPGSIFGHTFLRFDGEDEPVLLSQTLNYAARVDKHDSLLSYVEKGIFGGYRGFFKSRNYFETVQEYSDIENRDIWEYQLAFTAEEIEQLVRHVWEVKNIDFDYYFFRENCAYRLLTLLDVVRPGLQLTSKGNFSHYAIPVDTVRALDDKNLILTRHLRASLATRIDENFLYEDNTMPVMAIVSASGAVDNESIAEILKVLDTDVKKLEALQQSYNILQFYEQSSSQKTKVILRLINELSIQVPTTKVINLSKNNSPEIGHDSMRIAASYGEQNHRKYVDLKFRPSFHDLLDAPQGFVDGAAINFFDTRLKWFENNNLRLESLSLVNITSISPMSAWRSPVSWLFDFRFDRSQLSETQSVKNFISRGGFGVSVKQQTFKPYALLIGEWNLSSSYTKGYSLLLGLQLGLNMNYKANQLMVNYEVDNAVSGFDLDKNIAKLQWQYNMQVNHAVRFNYRQTYYDFYTDEDWDLGYYYYF